MQVTPSPRNPQKRTPGGRAKRKFTGVFPAMLIFAGFVALMVIVMPKEPLTHALTSIQGENGQAPTGVPSDIYKGLVISEVMASNRSSVPDENGQFNDWVEIWNSTDKPMDLTNVGLSDRADSVRFLFPSMILAPNGRVVVFASDTNSADLDGSFHAKFKISSVGETVYLFDPSAYVIDQVATPITDTDTSYALGSDGQFAQTQEYSPGFPNDQEGFLAYRNQNAVTDGALIINEVMADARTGLSDEDGELSDWIELYNTTDQPINLNKYALSDKENDPLKWRFPQDAVIPARGYYLVFCSGKDRLLSAGSIPHANFKISAERETVILSDSYGRLIDRVAIDNLAVDASYGRNESGGWQIYQGATPGMPNNNQGAARADLMLRAANPTGVYISEVMSSNSATTLSEDGDFCDWVELYNSSTEIVYLEGYGLSDNINRARKWQFPAGTAIYPGEYKVVYLDGRNTEESGRYHTSFKLSRAGGEVVALSDPTGRVLDKLSLPLIPTNLSYGRTSGLEGFFYYDAPTVGSANGTGFLGFAQTPSFTLKGGLYYQTITVDIQVPAGTTVFYTLDGSIPTNQSAPYQGQPLEMSSTTVLRARAYQQDLQPSSTITQTYLINVYHTLPIVSLVGDPDELWNETDGILASGGALNKEKIPFKLQSGGDPIYRTLGKVLRPGHVEYYQMDGTQVLSQGVEFALQGQYSLDMPQKTFKVKAKTAQGKQYFDAALFSDRPFTQYKSFVLRNSGNDCVWTRINDGFQSRLLDHLDTTVIHQAFNPVVVYLNGKYWGHYNMRERVDRYFVAQHEGLSLEEADNMDILESSSKLVYGSSKEYKALIEKAKSLSPGKNPEDLQYLLDRIDVDNYFDYMAIEMFFGNSDPGNIRYYKLKGEGQKWRWIFYDSDYGLFNSKFDSPTSYMDPKGAGQQNINNVLIRKLLDNDEMKEKFLRRLGVIFQKFTTEFMLSVFNETAAMIELEMPLHFARWAELNEKTINVDSPMTAEGALRYWRQRLDYNRNVIKKRPTYFYERVQNYFKLSDSVMTEYFGPKPPMPADALL